MIKTKKRTWTFRGNTLRKAITKVNTFSDYIEQKQGCDVYIYQILNLQSLYEIIVIFKVPENQNAQEAIKKAEEIDHDPNDN